MSVDTSTFEENIRIALALEMRNDPTYDADIVASKVSAVVRELLQKRRYKRSGMSDEAILADLDDFYSQVLNVARYDFNTIGAEGEDRHTENGVDRTFTERNRLWAGVVPISKVF